LGREARRLYDAWFDRTNALERRAVWAKMANKKRNSTRSGRRGGKASSARASRGLSGFQNTNSGDLNVRPPDQFSIPRNVPKDVANMLAWDVVKISSIITTPNTNLGITETNFSFSLASHPSASNWVGLYDQWFIPQFTVEFQSLMPPGSSTQPAVLYTALDFDNGTNLGSVSLLEDFATCASKAMFPQSATQRSVRPCTKPLIGSTTTVGLSRQWLDSSQSSTQNFGIRSIVVGNSTAAYGINVVVTIWFAFRNQI